MRREPEVHEQQAIELFGLLGRKWTIKVLKCLDAMQVCHFNQLQDDIPGLGTKMLSERLQELQDHGIVSKKTYDTDMPKTEYRLTEDGQALFGCISCVENQLKPDA